jgi:hypothetical protein
VSAKAEAVKKQFEGYLKILRKGSQSDACLQFEHREVYLLRKKKSDSDVRIDLPGKYFHTTHEIAKHVKPVPVRLSDNEH